VLQVSDVAALREQIGSWRRQGLRVAFVPTMGNLHAGHLALVRQAHTIADCVVVSIFVNPMQFAPDEDYDSYPRTLDEDMRQLESGQVSLLFTPSVEVLYPCGTAATTRVEVPGVGHALEEDFRPGFFVGVATVVARLLNLVQPYCAVFGEKDYQQLAVIRQMVADLCWPITVIGVPTIREDDGLALSSRNQYLSVAERLRAPLLYQTLERVADQVREGSPDYAALEDEAMKSLAEGGFHPDYVCIRHVDTLAPVSEGEMHCVVLAAAWLGRARLIDNLRVQWPG